MSSPSPIDRAAAQVTHTRGASLKLYRKNLQALVDEDTWHQILRTCSGPVAAFLSREVDPDEWVPTGWLIEAREVYLRCAGRNPWAARGGMMARPLYELGKDQGWFGGLGVGRVVADYPNLFAYLHRGGLAQVKDLAPGRAELILWADFPYAEYPADYLPRFFTSLLQIRGAGLVRVRYQGPGLGGWDHHYHLTWHEPIPGDGPGPR